MFDNSLPNCTFFLKVKISPCTLIPLFRPGSVHSGSASCDDYDKVFPDELCVSLFSDESHTKPGQWHSQPILILIGQGCMGV